MVARRGPMCSGPPLAVYRKIGPMKKSITELRDELNELRAKNESIYENVKAENRAATDEEMKTIADNQVRAAKLVDEITERNAELATTPEPTEERDGMTLQSAIRSAIENKTNVVEIGESRSADYLVTGTDAKGKVLMPTIVRDLMPSLRNRLLLARYGATVLTGVKGNLVLPYMVGSSAAWYAEDATASGTAGTFGAITLSPKRLSCVVAVSNMLLENDTVGAEQMIMNDVVGAISQAFEATVLGTAAGTATKPAGIFHGATVTGAANIAWSDIIGLETSVDSANASLDSAAYLMSTGLYGDLKSIVKASGEGAGFLLDSDKKLNGYAADRSNNVAASHIAFGDWSKFVIAQFGNIRLTIDPYTLAADDCVRIVVNALMDGGIRYPGAIAVKKVAAS